MQQVTVFPGGMIIHVEKGTKLRDLLMREGLLVDFPCGGRGLCNQCKVTIDPPTESGKAGKKPLSREEIASGVRLACQAVVEGDCSIYIPEEKEIEVVWRDPARAEGTQLLYGDPIVVRRRLRLDEPKLEDQRADWDRLHETLGREQVSMPEVTPEAAEGFSRILRESSWEVEAFIEDSHLICIKAPSDEPVYGFAIDLGTTTVDVSLHNLETGRRIGRKTMLNRQSAFGA
ncbi:MAG: 2Fe-2S iron-sulfur cluster binding domain-containing protein, partial [Spirochaetales bacterium]|nr:2Fe-2S iron-sulfur cluster binding domain-containing protein [Spirochaetales bacterium]